MYSAVPIDVPVLVLSPTADPTVLPHFGTEMIEAATASPSREIVQLDGANHYFSGQPEKLEYALDSLAGWIEANVAAG